MKETTKKFGSAPVFFTAISTILGAVMFLRFGFAVGTVGFMGTLAIILIGHAVTIPTAMAIAEIATNQKVEGGGEYYIVSRSFGLVIGSTIGITLYMSQAISVAFYIMAFTEAFAPLIDYIIANTALPEWAVWVLSKRQTIGIPALIILTYIMLTKGADLGVKTLYYVVAILAISMLAFFVGQTDYSKTNRFDPIATVYNTTAINDSTHIHIHGPEKVVDSLIIGAADAPPTPIVESAKPPIQGPNIPKIGFFTVFAIIFPAFTGMTAGVGLSGDLEDPGKSLPFGTLSATIVGMIIYILMAYKLTSSVSPEHLADTSRLVMSDVAWQGWWLIPLGLAAATISSALGSIMVAPRTLQAIARDSMFPAANMNRWIAAGSGDKDEPINASIITIAIAAVFIMAGAIDSVAEVISMFFMVTYGSLCLISFLNHFAADPSYRPKFRSKWYLSLFGAVACFGLMFFMNPLYAFVALVLMVGLYFGISWFNSDKQNMAAIFQGVIFQFSRQMQVFLQKAEKEQLRSWRPSAVALADTSFKRIALFDVVRWISQKYGFGTYIHHINGYVSKKRSIEARESKERLIQMAESSQSQVYMDTLISPSFRDSISQVVQLPGIAGTENNLLLLEFSKTEPAHLDDFQENFKLIKSVDYDLIILGSSERGFGLKKDVHIWITSSDYENANLMILIGYIISGHRDWRNGKISIFAVFPDDNIAQEKNRLHMLIEAGHLPISKNNITVITSQHGRDMNATISHYSRDADLTIVGFREEVIRHNGVDSLLGLREIGNTLFVHASAQKMIK